ncbi:thiamine phosphate synthase [Leptolyngbya sp. 7M]|uniref:thiamine phosphate synthase n=1 Tax=Leptolyngbya sp. 7M TaxID=2812896 RepID=UPI001B8D9005|nr:thiamine phosphate synthase [Leptolyngbya sp. 7M]QYO66280.1 thiamine phosphate synthase [Leptolyngbya sp. 7M]
MKLELPTIYPITDRAILGIPHSEQVRRLAGAGARFIQLRDKTMPSGELLYEAKNALEEAKKHNARLIINDRADIALLAGADGVHLGQDDLSPKEARKLLGENAIIGISTHSLEQASAAADEPIDYIAIGPIFATETKSDTLPVVGLEGVRNVRSVIKNVPLVAIGGIQKINVRDVIDAGASSAAVISALAHPKDNIEKAFRDLLISISGK